MYSPPATGSVRRQCIGGDFREKDSHGVYLLKKYGVNRGDVVKLHHAWQCAWAGLNDESDPELGNIGEGAKEKPQNPLDSFALNLNEEAKAGRIDPLIGREQEVTRLIQVLSRRRKNNPLFVGESGVG